MVIAPLVPGKAFVDDCGECGKKTEWWLEFGKFDHKTLTVELRFYCKSCEQSHNQNGWRRTLVAELRGKV